MFVSYDMGRGLATYTGGSCQCFFYEQIYDKYQQLAVQKISAMAIICKNEVSCPQNIILITTVNIFLVVITKGTICCLNCLIILQMKTCPIVVSMDNEIISMAIWLCSLAKLTALKNCPDINAQMNDKIVTHLFMCSNIYMGLGLNYDFIDAWKSGKKPSATRDITNKITPKGSVALSLCFWSPPKLYNIIPVDIKLAITIFLGPNAKFLSLTREQNTPTSTTDTILHDLTNITIGKFVRYIATMYVCVLMHTMIAHAIKLVTGIFVCYVQKKLLTTYPKNQAAPQGTYNNAIGLQNVFHSTVLVTQYGLLDLNKTSNTFSPEVPRQSNNKYKYPQYRKEVGILQTPKDYQSS